MSGINWPALTAVPTLKFGQSAWPVLLAHMILAAEDPNGLSNLHPKQPVPSPEEVPKHPNSYLDAVNVFIAYFHPNGKHYVPVKPEDEKYADLASSVSDLLERSRHHRAIPIMVARKLMTRVATWAVENKLASPAFKSQVLAWSKGDYAKINNALVQDADIGALFNEYTKLMTDDEDEEEEAKPDTPPPPANIDPNSPDAADQFLKQSYPDDYMFFTPVPLPKTVSSQEFNKLHGVPLVTGSKLELVKHPGQFFKLLRAYTTSYIKDEQGDVIKSDEPITVIIMLDTDGDLAKVFDTGDSEDPGLADIIVKGLLKPYISPQGAVATTASNQLPQVEPPKPRELPPLVPGTVMIRPDGEVMFINKLSESNFAAQKVAEMSPWSNAAQVYTKNKTEGWKNASLFDVDNVVGTKAAGFDPVGAKPSYINGTSVQVNGEKWSVGPVVKINKGHKLAYELSQTNPPIEEKDGIIEIGMYYVLWRVVTNGDGTHITTLWAGQQVVDALAPKPVPVPVQPEAPIPSKTAPDYFVGEDFAKWMAETNFKPAPTPDGFPFHVGSKVKLNGATAYIYGFVFIQKASGPPDVTGVIRVGKEFKTIPVAKIVAAELPYVETQSISTHLVVVSHNPAAEKIALTGPNYDSATQTMADLNPQPIVQPSFDMVKAGSKVSAGIVAVLMPGTTAGPVASNNLPIKTIPGPAIVLVHPLGDFGGYKLTFPKGTMDPGEGATRTAVREFWEETGMHGQPVAWLGDYHADAVKAEGNVTRLFIGYLKAGAPVSPAGKTNPWTGELVKPETDAVYFAALDGYAQAPWFSKLSARDKQVVADTAAWLNTNGFPVKGMEAFTKSDVDPSASPEYTSWANYKAGAEFVLTKAHEGMQATIPDYQVASWMLYAIGEKIPKNLQPWAVASAAPLVTLGYPMPGVTVAYNAGKAKLATKVVQSGAYLLYAYISVPIKVGGKATGLVMYAALKSKGTGEVEMLALYNSSGGTSEGTVPPEAFTIITTDMPATMITTKPNVSLWDLFQKRAPYPVNSAMVEKLIAAAKEHGSPVQSIAASRTSNNLPPAGHSATIKGALREILGYAVLSHMDGKNAHYVFAADAGVPELYTLFDLNHAGTMFIPEPGAKRLVHTNKVIDAMFAYASYQGDPVQWLGSRGYGVQATLKLMSQAIPKLAWTKAPASLLPLLCACFRSPCPVTAMQWDGLLKAIGSVDPMQSMDYVPDAPAVPAGTESPPVVVTVPSAAPAAKTAVQSGTYNALKGKLELLKAADLQATSTKLSGGSNPHMVLVNPKTGERWFLKGAKDNDPIRYIAEEVASNIYAQFIETAVPAKVFQHGSFKGAIQPLLDGTTPGLDFSKYTAAQITVLLRNHVIDMFWGDHDAKADNYIIDVMGALRPIDKGQTLRFFAQGVDGILDSYAIMTGNDSNRPLGKRVLMSWAEKKVEIPPGAFGVMRQMIEMLVNYPMPQIAALTKAYTDHLYKGNEAQTASFLGRIGAWQKSYLKLWTEEMKKLAAKRGEEFVWPGVASVKPTPKAKTASAVDDVAPEAILDFDLSKITAKHMGMTAREEHIIAKDVAASGWRGKSIRVDKGFVENQEVFIKPVRYNAGGTISDGVLLTWRVTYEASAQATEALKQHAHEVFATVGPQPLPFDNQQKISDKNLIRYYATIRRALGHFNHNVAKSKDGGTPKGQPDIAFLKNVVNTFTPELEDLNAQAQQASGKLISVVVGGQTYKVAPAALVGMVGKYLPNLQELALAIDDWEKNGQNGKYWNKVELTYVEPYLWQAPKEESEAPKATGYAVSAVKQGLQPNTSVIDNSKILMLYEGGVPQYSSSFQFIITGTGANKVHIHFNPATLPGGGEGTRTHWGQCWAAMPKAASPETVAKVLALFEKATGIGMKTATKLDNEIHFWAKQAYALQPGYVDPTAKGSGVVPGTALAQGLSLYSQGKDEEARNVLRAHVAATLKVTPEQASEMAAKSAYMEGQYTEVEGANLPETGAGRRRFMRLGYDREDVFKLFGPNAAIAHNVKTPMKTFVQRVGPKNGALVAKANFASYVGPWQGDTSQAAAGSSSSDFAVGGATNLFLAMRSAKQVKSRHLYFDLSLILRTDTYVIAPHGDGFGDFMRARALSLEAIKKATGDKGTKGLSEVSDGEDSQLVARHEIDLQEWLYYAGCQDEDERQVCISLCKQCGLTSFFAGRTPEQVFVVAGATPGIVT